MGEKKAFTNVIRVMEVDFKIRTRSLIIQVDQTESEDTFDIQRISQFGSRRYMEERKLNRSVI